jgi:DNA-binding NarL/FixJ family response regulator
MPIRLTIVDAHTLIRCGLRELLSHHPGIEIVAEAAPAVATARPDVVTLDSSLPDGDGLRLSRELRDARRRDLGVESPVRCAR